MIAPDDFPAGSLRPTPTGAGDVPTGANSAMLRAKVIERGRRLAAWKDYPSPAMLRKLSERILVSREWNAGPS